MYPAAFEYLKPRSIGEAIELLRSIRRRRQASGRRSEPGADDEAPSRPAQISDRYPSHSLISTTSVKRRVRFACGAMTRHVQIEDSRIHSEKNSRYCARRRVRSAMPRFETAARSAAVWSRRIHPATMGRWFWRSTREMKCIGPRGERVIPAADFFTFAYTTALQSDEILTEMIFPIPQQQQRWSLSQTRARGR